MNKESETKIRANLKRLRNLAPKREDFQDVEQYAEAKSGFIHRIGPSIQYGESLLKRISEEAQDEGDFTAL